jgi:hypothetical protein
VESPRLSPVIVIPAEAVIQSSRQAGVASTAECRLRHLGAKIEAYDSIQDGELPPTGMSRRNHRRVYPVKARLREIPLLFPC